LRGVTATYKPAVVDREVFTGLRVVDDMLVFISVVDVEIHLAFTVQKEFMERPHDRDFSSTAHVDHAATSSCLRREVWRDISRLLSVRHGHVAGWTTDFRQRDGGCKEDGDVTDKEQEGGTPTALAEETTPQSCNRPGWSQNRDSA
jgi:hypothetical protein